MKVLVFDIDGTLTATTAIDGRLFAEALHAVFVLPPGEPWSDITELTDAAIVAEVCAMHAAGDHDSATLEVQRRFLESLEEAVERQPNEFSPVPGAREIFARVRSAGWTPAIATGAWRRSAETKLSAAEIPVDGVPLSTSSEHVRRVDIIRHAVRLAATGREPSHVVYVGDGVWDVRACKELEIGFIGRADDGWRLREMGATAVVPDFEEAGALIELLTRPDALVPQNRE